MDLIAKLPCIAAKIYRNLYREASSIGAIDPSLDWSHNFTNMLGYSEAQFTELMRLYLTIHRSVPQRHTGTHTQTHTQGHGSLQHSVDSSVHQSCIAVQGESDLSCPDLQKSCGVFFFFFNF